MANMFLLGHQSPGWARAATLDISVSAIHLVYMVDTSIRHVVVGTQSVHVPHLGGPPDETLMPSPSPTITCLVQLSRFPADYVPHGLERW